jgi:hypothetical protein
LKAGLKVGQREVAFTSKTPFTEEVGEILVDLVLEMSGTRVLRKETTQTTLDL